MPTANHQSTREHDIVLFGATGFTGGLVAQHLAAKAPVGLRWAIAGRSAEKLEKVRGSLGLPELEVLVADVSDPASLASLAASTKVVVTTVGPYLAHGEPLVKACAEAGTDYIDLTGEPEFVDRMFTKYDAVARESGARIVHAAGFDSIPHDLGAFYTVRQLEERGGPITEPLRIEGIVRTNGGMSGGTFHSALDQFARAPEMGAAARERARVEKRPEGRTSRAVRGRPTRKLGYYLLPLPTIDPLIVKRSGAALAAYGPAFSYSHYAGIR
ncbi:MAG: saccharopine dehydrogenase NADP-binding domain-containing protein, partial [Nocardioides sp.]|nr:saccharopine dehydrogenase NADP-binding domain-containing protein [Nocardioides sp.]